MGRAATKSKRFLSSFFILLLLTFTTGSLSFALKEDAKNPCAGVLRDVYVLGGMVKVDGVEEIHLSLREKLEIYDRGESVQSQLQTQPNFGYVGILDESIAGYVVAERRNRYVSILNIAVTTEKQRRGMGSDLLHRLEQDAKSMPGIEEVRVLVAYHDEDSLRFFENAGYKLSEVISNKFSRGTVSAKLLKKTVREESPAPQLQLATKPKIQPRLVTVETIPISLEELRKLDPTLVNSR